jgi:hypothetical protein
MKIRKFTWLEKYSSVAYILLHGYPQSKTFKIKFTYNTRKILFSSRRGVILL